MTDGLSTGRRVLASAGEPEAARRGVLVAVGKYPQAQIGHPYRNFDGWHYPHHNTKTGLGIEGMAARP